MRDFEKEIKEKAVQIEAILASYLPAEEGCQRTLFEAMNYSIHAGGKRLRPMLMQETYRMLGGREKIVEPFMAAIEMIHTYSLVHDDLPAMDNDEYRRGKKSTHAQFGEAMGILAGDALLNYAFETALKAFDMQPMSAEGNRRIAKALQLLAKKAGAYGMIGGQVVDVAAEGKEIDMDTILFIHENKTAAMLESAMMIGATLAGAEPEQLKGIEELASQIGLAFQIQDDILDVTGSEQQLGKPVGSDAKNQKSTYVTLVGLEQAKKQVEELSESAICRLKELSADSAFLEMLVASLIDRRS